MKRVCRFLAATASLVVVAGCTSFKLDTHHTVEPIHITMDINLKIQSDLDAYFDEVDKAAKEAADKAEEK